ncbi:MAG: glycoside hydrolase family 16 protein [Sterolibacterium sp.]
MRKHFRILLAVFFLSLSSSGDASSAEPLRSPEWRLAWSDEFDGAHLDEAKWTAEVGGNGWGNRELQYYTASDNVEVRDGYLTILARPQDHGRRHYTSARLITKGKAAWTYGKVEARLKLPYGQGLWPAFWMLGENVDAVGWPRCGEIDIMEMVGGKDKAGANANAVAWGSLHRPNADDPRGGAAKKSVTAEYRGKVDLANDFHVFGVEWDATTLKYYVDGQVYLSIDVSANADGFEVFRRPFFIILNLAVGGDWPGSPDRTTVWPQRLQVDWVRVYQKTGPS